MTKRPDLPSRPATAAFAAQSRTDQIIAIMDHCAAAKALAETAGNPFLAYLLAMTIQEARSSLRPGHILDQPMVPDPTRR